MSKSHRVKSRQISSISIDQVKESLGNVSVPGDIDAFVSALLAPATNVIRVRDEVSAAELPMPTTPVPWYRLGRRIETPTGRPSRFLAYAAGDYFIQDAGSLLALAAIGADSPMAGKVICDLCAAPGGKATALVEAIGDSGFVLANEAIRSRLPALRYNMARTGSDRYAISCSDPDQLAEKLGGVFDAVLVDAPCSGQAMVASGKQSKSSLLPKQIQHSAARQNRILDAACKMLRPGGMLIYSTCTFAEAENEAQIDRLIESGTALPNPIAHLSTWETTAACYRLWPHLHECGGSFAASMVVDRPPEPSSTRDRRIRQRQPDRLPVDLAEWYQYADEQVATKVLDSVILGWPADLPDWVKGVADSGPELAHRAGQTWKPAHAGGLRRLPRCQAKQRFNVDAQTACKFLRGETIDCDLQGWCVVQWKERPIGWVKSNGKIGKNHLPSAARMQGALSE
ncbi:MAG: SAM-dependent methyltransferase [Rubripirellula sp.]